MTTDARFATNADLPLTVEAPITDADIVEAMERFGGSFVRGLAQLYQRADPVNQVTLRTAFNGYWNEYAEIVTLKRQRREITS